jgi:hypothetical protein
MFPEVQKRRVPESPYPTRPEASIYHPMRAVAKELLGITYVPVNGMPMFLICDYCGNIQVFRLDLASDGHGENWQP